MIKLNATVCGNIVSSAEEKTANDGSKFISFAIVTAMQGSDQTVKELHINVSAPFNAETMNHYSTGRRVTVNGVVHIRKNQNVEYWNMRTDKEAEFNESTVPDRLEGSMEFLGKIGKKGIEDRKSKKGKDFQTFSAFSSDKNGENREFTWVNFVVLNPIHADYFAAEKYVEVHGDLRLNVTRATCILNAQLNLLQLGMLARRKMAQQRKHSSKHLIISFGYVVGVLSLGTITAAYLLLSRNK